ncbi:MAG: hypothetical protein OXF66_04775 [Gammaproteobacteria bacterium]|nr:hypothetical protein [Gammaproteobacteria bacterium]
MSNAHHLGLSIPSAAWLRPPPKADDAALHEILVAFNPMILWESEPSAALFLQEHPQKRHRNREIATEHCIIDGL